MAENVVAKILAKLETADSMADGSGVAMQRAEMAMIEAIQALQVAKGALYGIIGDEDVGSLHNYAVALSSSMDMLQASIGQVRVAYGNIGIGKGYGQQFRSALRRDITG